MCSVSISSKAEGEILSWSAPAPDSINLNYISPEAAATNTVHHYSGRHDHGKLPVLKTSGPMADVISGVIAAKNECDRFLTTIIDKEYANADAKMDVNEAEEEEADDTENQAKKMKT